VEGQEGISAGLGFAAFASESMLWRAKYPALRNHPGRKQCGGK